MEEESQEQEENSPAIVSGFSFRELEVFKEVEIVGFKPISPTLSAQLFELFLEGYSCAEIARKNPSFSEADILNCRKRHNWDDNKDRYAYDLQLQVREKLVKQKMESIEFLTNMMAVTHKAHKDKMMKYLQTGRMARQAE